MSRLETKPSDETLHERAIESLSEELKLPRTQVEVAYGFALARLRKDAAVADFIAVFARRGARECLLCVERKSACLSREDCLHAAAGKAGRAGDGGTPDSPDPAVH